MINQNLCCRSYNTKILVLFIRLNIRLHINIFTGGCQLKMDKSITEYVVEWKSLETNWIGVLTILRNSSFSFEVKQKTPFHTQYVHSLQYFQPAVYCPIRGRFRAETNHKTNHSVHKNQKKLPGMQTRGFLIHFILFHEAKT